MKLPADLAARLEAAGLPTDLEGMLKACIDVQIQFPNGYGYQALSLQRDSWRGWKVTDYPRCDYPDAYAWHPTEAVAHWLLAARGLAP